MKRQTEREQLIRLTVKTLDQVFIMQTIERLGCSQFEAQALTNLVLASRSAPDTNTDNGPELSNPIGVGIGIAIGIEIDMHVFP